MARPLRIELAGGLYHVTSRGDRREDIYVNDEDRSEWVRVFGEVCERFNWRCHAYCLMTNHYHIVVETADGNLSQGMRQLNGVYTQRFNLRHHLVGYLFQGRYKAILVERETYLLESKPGFSCPAFGRTCAISCIWVRRASLTRLVVDIPRSRAFARFLAHSDVARHSRCQNTKLAMQISVRRIHDAGNRRSFRGPLCDRESGGEAIRQKGFGGTTRNGVGMQDLTPGCDHTPG
jgi:REP element-mobilizing transposase RayT